MVDAPGRAPHHKQLRTALCEPLASAGAASCIGSVIPAIRAGPHTGRPWRRLSGGAVLTFARLVDLVGALARSTGRRCGCGAPDVRRRRCSGQPSCSTSTRPPWPSPAQVRRAARRCGDALYGAIRGNAGSVAGMEDPLFGKPARVVHQFTFDTPARGWYG